MDIINNKFPRNYFDTPRILIKNMSDEILSYWRKKILVQKNDW